MAVDIGDGTPSGAFFLDAGANNGLAFLVHDGSFYCVGSLIDGLRLRTGKYQCVSASK